IGDARVVLDDQYPQHAAILLIHHQLILGAGFGRATDRRRGRTAAVAVRRGFPSPDARSVRTPQSRRRSGRFHP
ncbi:hypothetical protein, partial [Streptomyces sp. ICBB 8177]|uniref:hypothetical protein n=1 Tax=Streptomyces sp. ICBB 8177 TaxID=563922 RepID=UPI001A7E0A9B